MREWQPIETAPRDGADILVWDGDNISIAFGRSNGTFEHVHFACGDIVESFPTHWMPLPPPPESQP